jgi:BolA protein
MTAPSKSKLSYKVYMIIQDRIQGKLSATFTPSHLEVINESFMHNVPEGSESHFKVVIVSEQFVSQRLIGRHRAVNAALAEELAEDIHALAIHTYTEQEWQKLQHSSPDSPNCLGGMHK